MARLGVVLLALLVAAAAVACLPSPASASAGAQVGELSSILLPRASPSARACDGAVGHCGVDEEEEMGTWGGAGEALRRSLARQPTTRYISYAALRADQVPCNKRGQSYYGNCGANKQANPYQRGCSAITRCQRNTN